MTVDGWTPRSGRAGERERLGLAVQRRRVRAPPLRRAPGRPGLQGQDVQARPVIDGARSSSLFTLMFSRDD